MAKGLIFQGFVELIIELRMVKNELKCMNESDRGFPTEQDQFQNVNIPPYKRYPNIVIL